MQIPVSHGHLEAQVRTAEGAVRGAAVVCHPHPQHGGTMHTKAVFRAAQAITEVGLHALRFNFRGVGTSTGAYGGGAGEEEDLEAAIHWLERRHPELPILVAGFSFGARVGLAVGLRDERVKAMIGLGFPWEMYDTAFLEESDKPILFVQGDEDEFGGGEVASTRVAQMRGPIELRVVAGSDHYFHDHFEELQRAVREYLTTGPAVHSFPMGVDD